MSRVSLAGLVPAQEMVAFQVNDPVGHEMEALIQEMYDYIDNGARVTNKQLMDTFGKRFEEIIWNRFNLKISLIINDVWGAMMPLYTSTQHIFVDAIWRGEDMGTGKLIREWKRVVEDAKKNPGVVDLDKAKLGGAFSKHVHDAWLGVLVNKKLGLTPAEQTAIFLHEVGHAFTYYEYSNRITETNLTLQLLVTEVMGKQNKEQIEYYTRELEKKNSLAEGSLDDLQNCSNRYVYGLRMVDAYFTMIKSGFHNQKYFETNSESVADVFATRFGYGREIVTGLDKIITTYKGNSAARLFQAVVEVTTNAMGVLYFIGAGLSLGGPLLAAAIALLVVWLIGFLSGTNGIDMTYDTDVDRFQRVRNQAVQSLKITDIDQAYKDKTLNDIKIIDTIIERQPKSKRLMKLLGDFLFKRHRDARDAIELQQQLELLSANDFFVKSAELSTLNTGKQE